MKLDWRSVLGVLLSIALLWWVLHGNLTGVEEHLRRANIWLLILSALVATMVFPLRAIRWRPILASVEERIPYGKLWRATAIGAMVTNVVPVRAGELARAYALAREVPRVPFSTAFASIAVDRVFDAVVVLLLMLLAMFDPVFPRSRPIAGHPVSNYIGGATLVVIAALLALYAVVFFPQRIIGWYELLARRVAPRFEARGRDLLLAFTAGLGVLRQPRRFGIIFFWTVAHWLTNALAYWIAFKALGIDAPYSAALLLQGLLAIAVALPSAPGFFGVFELVGSAGLSLYGVERSLAVSWAISFHLFSFVPITLIGIWYFGRMGLHFRDIRRAGTGEGA